jgi:drug/metabolite transporter (DMT)-like permease
MAYIYFVALGLIWGTNFLLMKKAVFFFTPLSVAALRVTGGGLFLLLIYLLRRDRWPFDRNDLFGLLLIVLLGYAWPFGIQPHLIQYCGSGFIGMMVCFVPLLTLVISIPMLGIYPTPRQLLGVVGGLLFLPFMFADGLQRQIDGSHFLLAVSVPLGYAICNTFIKRRFAQAPIIPLTLTCLGATFLLLVPLAASGPLQTAALPESLPTALICVSLLGMVGTGIALLIFIRLLQSRGPLFAGMVTYIVPAVALLLGSLDGEQVTPLQIGALCGVLAMVAIVQWPAPRPAVSEP